MHVRISKSYILYEKQSCWAGGIGEKICQRMSIVSNWDNFLFLDTMEKGKPEKSKEVN